MYVIGVLSVMIFLSPINFGPNVIYVYWTYYGSLHIASFSKIMGFETNSERRFTKSSVTSLQQIEMKTTESSGRPLSTESPYEDSREHDFSGEF
jgi:hypothetical protein